MSTALALHQPQTGVLARIGTPEERQYLIQIMAEQIGIPARDAQRTDVVALLAAAAQRTIQFGWIPGIHVHVQKFETAASKKNREKNPSASPVYSYTLVVGEKAYKDSGTRWRERGVNWRYQRKPMTREEVEEEARLQGFTERLPAHAYGMWSRIIIWGQDDPQNDDDPLWSAGVWLGKIKAGNYWNADALPTGVSSRDVAIRRADKRAMMQSQLTLLPVDDMGADERVQRLVQQLRSEAADRHTAPMLKPDRVEIEDDGDALWAKTTPARPAAPQPSPAIVEEGQFSWHDDVDFSSDVIAQAAPAEEPEEEPEPSGARPDAPAARPEGAGARPDIWGDEPDQSDEPEPGARPEGAGARLNSADGPCPECHAPAGKMHATNCPTLGDPGARPAEPEAGARPARSGARPTDVKPEAFPARFMKRLLTVKPAEVFNPDIAEFVRKARNAEKDSVTKMTGTYWKALVGMVHAEMRFQDAADTFWVLSLLIGYEVDDTTRPGQLVHGYLMKLLREQRVETLDKLAVLHDYAHILHENMIAEASQ